AAHRPDGPSGNHGAGSRDVVRHPHQRGLLRGRPRAARLPDRRARQRLLLRHDGARLRAHHARLDGVTPPPPRGSEGVRPRHGARRPSARRGSLGASRDRGSRDARRGRPPARPPERVAHRSRCRAHQGRLDGEGIRHGAERAARLRRHGDPRARGTARARRPGGAAARPAPVALHDRSPAAIRRRHERDPALHHRAARARPAAQVTMDFGTGVDQQAVQAAARRFLAAELTRERRRAWEPTAEGHDAAFWSGVAQLGWFGYGLPRDRKSTRLNSSHVKISYAVFCLKKKKKKKKKNLQKKKKKKKNKTKETIQKQKSSL